MHVGRSEGCFITARALTLSSRFVLYTTTALLLLPLGRMFEEAVAAVVAQALVVREEFRDWTGVIGQNTGALGFSETDCLVLPKPLPPPLLPEPFPKPPLLPPLTQYERSTFTPTSVSVLETVALAKSDA